MVTSEHLGSQMKDSEPFLVICRVLTEDLYGTPGDQKA